MNKKEDINDDMGESSSMICVDHPNNISINPGGICAFCLQEKLGKLVSSSFPIAIFPASSSSSSSSSFRSNHLQTTTTSKKLFIPFLLSHKKQQFSSDLNQNVIILKRSQSTSTQRRSFWSFLQNHSKTAKSSDSILKYPDPDQSTTIDRKVSRSRSVGCGSRSFSGDFLERIGDCATFRRVESQREGKSSSATERVKCGGLFGGFAMTSSSSSSSSSSYRGWAFASPLRGLKKKPSSMSRNLSGVIPPLLSVSSGTVTTGGVYL